MTSDKLSFYSPPRASLIETSRPRQHVVMSFQNQAMCKSDSDLASLDSQKSFGRPQHSDYIGSRRFSLPLILSNSRHDIQADNASPDDIHSLGSALGDLVTHLGSPNRGVSFHTFRVFHRHRPPHPSSSTIQTNARKLTECVTRQISSQL